MPHFIFLLIAVFTIIVCVLYGWLSRERDARKKTEQDLQTTRKTLKDLCETCIKENNSSHARIVYQVYWGKPVEHSGDGFIDGYE